MSLNERLGAVGNSFMDRYFNIVIGCLLAICALMLLLVATWAAASLLFPHPVDDRTCVHRTPMLVGKVTTYVCDIWGTASPTDPRP